MHKINIQFNVNRCYSKSRWRLIFLIYLKKIQTLSLNLYTFLKFLITSDHVQANDRKVLKVQKIFKDKRFFSFLRYVIKRTLMVKLFHSNPSVPSNPFFKFKLIVQNSSVFTFSNISSSDLSYVKFVEDVLVSIRINSLIKWDNSWIFESNSNQNSYVFELCTFQTKIFQTDVFICWKIVYYVDFYFFHKIYGRINLLSKWNWN